MEVSYILIALAVTVVVVIATLVHAGLFYEVRIRMARPLHLPHRAAYQVHQGPYSAVGTLCRKVREDAPNRTLFGVYYDDPKKVPKDKTRCIIGCCLLEPADSRLENHLKSLGYSIWVFPECSNAVITEFPDRSFLSNIVAPYRVYYGLGKYAKKRGLQTGPYVEMYGTDCIHYTGPLENRDGFFVPEIVMETESKKAQ